MGTGLGPEPGPIDSSVPAAAYGHLAELMGPEPGAARHVFDKIMGPGPKNNWYDALNSYFTVCNHERSSPRAPDPERGDGLVRPRSGVLCRYGKNV